MGVGTPIGKTGLEFVVIMTGTVKTIFRQGMAPQSETTGLGGMSLLTATNSIHRKSSF